MSPAPPRQPPSQRLRGDILLPIVLVLIVVVVAWWWATVGQGRQRFRAAEPTPADASAPPH